MIPNVIFSVVFLGQTRCVYPNLCKSSVDQGFLVFETFGLTIVIINSTSKLSSKPSTNYIYCILNLPFLKHLSVAVTNLLGDHFSCLLHATINTLAQIPPTRGSSYLWWYTTLYMIVSYGILYHWDNSYGDSFHDKRTNIVMDDGL